MKQKYLAFAVLILTIIGAGFLASKSNVIITDRPDKVLAGGVSEPSCSVSSTEVATIGDDISTTILSADQTRAWARIGVTSTSTQDIYLSFDEGAAAVVGQGVRISATSSPDNIEVGRNTTFPYVGAITGITSSATTSLLVTDCTY